jgi:hypothetical protein
VYNLNAAQRNSLGCGGCACTRRCRSRSTARKTLWADNADRLSQLYGGAWAQKTDVTRMLRYVINHFDDARRQDAWNLFTGRFRPSPGGGPGEDAHVHTPTRARKRQAHKQARGQAAKASSSLVVARTSAPTPWRVALHASLLFSVVTVSVAVLVAQVAGPATTSLADAPPHPFFLRLRSASAATSAPLWTNAVLAAEAAYLRLPVGALAGTAALGLAAFFALSKGALPGHGALVAKPALCPEPPVSGYSRARWEEEHAKKKAHDRKA